MKKLVPSPQLLRALSRFSRIQTSRYIYLYHQDRSFSQSCHRVAKKDTKYLDPETLKAPPKSAGASSGPQFKSGRLGPSLFDSIPEPEGPEEYPLSITSGRAKPLVPSEGEKAFEPQSLRRTVENPRPRAQIRWLQKKVVQDVKGRHRLNRTEKILKSERYHMAKSPFVKTSIKKLGPIARQIAGKPIEEALVQLRFSKKKAAQDVLKHLKYTRDQAIVGKGMGLGKDIAPGVPKAEGSKLEAEKSMDPIKIRDRYGKRRTITDPSAMYVDQAWVGRGSFGYDIDYRARGQGHRLRLPWTSISILLKEERTRIREHTEKEQKKQQKAPWVQLPDRPVTAQRQYTLW